jgi:hypothetical protein
MGSGPDDADDADLKFGARSLCFLVILGSGLTGLTYFKFSCSRGLKLWMDWKISSIRSFTMDFHLPQKSDSGLLGVVTIPNYKKWASPSFERISRQDPMFFLRNDEGKKRAPV